MELMLTENGEQHIFFIILETLFMKYIPAYSAHGNIRYWTPILGGISGSCVMLALSPILAWWVLGFWIAAVILNLIYTYLGRNEVFSYTFRLLLVIFLSGIATMTYWDQGWQMVMAQALALMLSIKLMELRKQRDAFQFCGLGVLGLGVASIVRFDLSFGVLIFSYFFSGLVLILWQHIFDQVPKTGKSFGLSRFFSVRLAGFALFLTMVTVMLGFLLFFAFPRNINPVLNLGAGLEISRTGFSAEMTPGGIAGIAESNRIAFRTQVNQILHSSQLYWRGAVLWKTDGTNWTPGTPHDFQSSPLPSAIVGEDVVSQIITLNPGRTEHLFGLYFPGRVMDLSGVRYNRDGTVKLNEVPENAVRYQVYSVRENKDSLSSKEKSAGLAIPDGVSHSVYNIAESFAEDNSEPWDIAQSILFYFNTQGFSYSLSAPPGFEQGQTLEDFLIRTRVGYCELYAAAMVMFLRLNNIPSRVVVGFWGGEYNPVGEYWIVRDSMAHAWVEAWFADRGWVKLDPTRHLDRDMSEDQDEASVSDNIPAEQMLSPSVRVVDWLRWQWTNWVIDLNLARQARMWRSVRTSLEQTWTEIQMPDPRDFLKNVFLERKSVMVGLVLSGSTLILILSGLILKRVRPTREHLRTKAGRLLAAKTPGRHDLSAPGAERQVWEWWSSNYPEKAGMIRQVYNDQRYGPRPDRKKENLLRDLLVR